MSSCIRIIPPWSMRARFGRKASLFAAIAGLILFPLLGIASAWGYATELGGRAAEPLFGLFFTIGLVVTGSAPIVWYTQSRRFYVPGKTYAIYRGSWRYWIFFGLWSAPPIALIVAFFPVDLAVTFVLVTVISLLWSGARSLRVAATVSVQAVKTLRDERLLAGETVRFAFTAGDEDDPVMPPLVLALVDDGYAFSFKEHGQQNRNLRRHFCDIRELGIADFADSVWVIWVRFLDGTEDDIRVRAPLRQAGTAFIPELLLALDNYLERGPLLVPEKHQSLQ